MSSGNVVSAGVLDSSHATDSIIVTGWVLDRALEPKKIEYAWAKLVAAWPILISRLRRNSSNKQWEYQNPPTDSASNTISESFTTLVVPGTIHEHYRYSKPSEEIRCTMKENPFHLFLPKVPSSVEDLLHQDIPLTRLQVTLFDDATLVGLSTPHIFCDGYGVKAIIRALTHILSGGTPPPPLTLVDPFKPYANASQPLEPPPYWRVLNTIQTIVLVVWTFWRWVWERPIQNRDIFFPQDAVARIKSEAMSDLRKENREAGDLWISSSDALLAFCLKCIHPATKSQTPFNVFYTANLRKLLEKTIPQSYIHNAVCMVITPTLPLSAISDMSLGALALHIRRTLESQTTPSAIDRWIKWHIGTSGLTRIFFEPSGAYYVVTNWRDMSLMRVDFSGALPEDSHSETVKCVYMWGNGIQPIPLRNWIGLWADDPRGGVWVSGFLPESIWENWAGFGKFIE